MTDPISPTEVTTRKKRLSRKEQKARKKQRRQQEKGGEKETDIAAPQSDNCKISSSSNDKIPDNKDPKPTTVSKKSHTLTPQPLQEHVPYIPTPLPESDNQKLANTNRLHNRSDNKTLGKWFPKARVVKSRPSTTQYSTILLFYQYKSPEHWSEKRVAQLMHYLECIAETRPYLGGRLRVAPEGINATLSCGDSLDGGNGRTILEHFCNDLQRFDDVFRQTDFKYLPAKADRHFKDLKILPVQELVYYGLQERQAPLQNTGVHLEAEQFHEMLQDTSQQTVVVDVRNHYEAALGRFDGQAIDGKGAQYVDPKMRKSTDFPSWVKQSAEQLKGKRVMMYCTGGVRCERASAYLKSTMGDELAGIYQLQGGIERYLQAFPDGGFWRGKNFVFDKRESVSAVNPDGDGGVLRGKTSRQMSKGIGTRCCLCDAPWDRYIGKKKCETCGVPVLMCDKCIQLHKQWHKNKDSKRPKLARCPLCVEQDITVPADKVDYTDNGVKTKPKHVEEKGRAAPSVCKWGGGHASQKKERRRTKPHRKDSQHFNEDVDSSRIQPTRRASFDEAYG